ncbi:MAG: hypothetical protein J6Q30_04880 [Oscillospiraceae bacterium]|nr:hypothetical protein [Oscillospiraceae bacterium]
MRKQKDFRPDPTEASWKNRLHLTKSQRSSLLKWVLYGLFLLLLSLVQDAVMSRFEYRGATTDLVPCGILLICLLQTPDTGAIFALVSSSLYILSGSAQGYYCIVLLTFLGVLLNILRHSLLSRRFRSIFLCIIVGLMVYELAVFAFGLFLGKTYFSRISVSLTTGILSIATVPVLYPIAFSVSKIGGEKWKD